VKRFCIVVNFFIWIVIKNYWCDIKSENVLMLINSEKYIKKKKEKYINSCCSILLLDKQAHRCKLDEASIIGR
jgi:hypothetical protein